MLAPRRAWLGILLINVLLVGAVLTAAHVIADNYIEERRKTTLLYESHSSHRFQLRANQKNYRNSRDGLVHFFDVGPNHLRGDVPTTPKPEDTLRLFVIGGSSVFDHLSKEPSWPVQIGLSLSKMGLKTEGFNAGVPGYSSYEAIAAYEDTLSAYKPDVVVLYQGWNDAKYMQPFLDGVKVEQHYKVRDWSTRYRFLFEPWPDRHILAWERMYEDFGRRSGLAETKPRALKPAPTTVEAWMKTPGIGYWRSNLERFATIVEKSGAMPVLAAQVTLLEDNIDEKIRKNIRYDFVGIEHASLIALNEAMALVLKEVAAKKRIPFIDVRSKFLGQPQYFSDHVHLRPAGSQALGEAMAQALASMFQTKTATMAAPFVR